MVTRRTAFAMLVSLFLLAGVARAADPILVDHTCADIVQIPESAILAAKAKLHIAYGHTSHGSQLIAGMGTSQGAQLDAFMTANGATPGLYLWNSGGTNGALDLRDRPFSGANDLGNPNRTAWAAATRTWLAAHPETNVIIWSWCGQAATSIANIDTYLDLMEGLIADFPEVHFVFMTGHLTGTGPNGTLNLANEHIRKHCRTHGRILYDFADIESFDPDGLVDYMRLGANDNCDYDSDGNGSRDRNWAVDWQNSHTEGTDWWASGAAHSQHLNGNRKGYAAWWLWARLAGWGACIEAPSGLTGAADSVAGTVRLDWTDRSADETAFVVQRRVGGGAWNDAYAVLAANSTTFTDAGLAPGRYSYRVAARAAGSGTCDSPPSNTVVVEIDAPPEPGPAPKLRPLLLPNGKKQTGRTVLVDARVKGDATGCRAWEMLDGAVPPEYVSDLPVDGVYRGLTVRLDDDPSLPRKRRICVQVVGDGGESKVMTKRVRLVAPHVKRVLVAGGRMRSDPALILELRVKRDAVGYRIWEDQPGAVPPAYTMQDAADGGYRGLARTLSSDPALPQKRVLFVQVRGEGLESKVIKTVIRLR